ncbi:MAG: metal ABC transporter ATP-binding protein [Muribaculaceae bacterium]
MNSQNNPLIVLDSITVKWNEQTTLDNISFTIFKGDFVAITGPNGGGKTTLLKVILNLLKPTRGSVKYASERLKIGYLPQKNMIDSHFPITLREVVESGLLASNYDKDTINEKVSQMLELVQLTEHASKPIGTLSGGQLQRGLLGRALISDPEILVLDEPLSYIDKHFEHRIYDILSSLSPHTTIILVSHEMTAISAMANRHLIVDKTLHECSAAHHYFRTECE